jgi:hypothetical protein
VRLCLTTTGHNIAGCLLRQLAVDFKDMNAGTGLRKCLRNSQPNTAGPTRNQGGFIFE